MDQTGTYGSGAKLDPAGWSSLVGLRPNDQANVAYGNAFFAKSLPRVGSRANHIRAGSRTGSQNAL
jgi:hypothetical protein